MSAYIAGILGQAFVLGCRLIARAILLQGRLGRTINDLEDGLF